MLKCHAILKTKKETVIETKVLKITTATPVNVKRTKFKVNQEVKNQIGRRAQYSTTVAIADQKSEFSDDYAIRFARPKRDNLMRAVSR